MTELKITPGPWTIDEATIKGPREDMYPILFERIHATEADTTAIAAVPDLIQLALQYASECGECAGTRITPDDQPCTECEDVWKVLEKAGATTPKVTDTRARASRWACPACGSRDVEIALPAWFRETDGFTLDQTSVDAEADILYWACNDCDGNGCGDPIDTLQAEFNAQLDQADLFEGTKQ